MKKLKWALKGGTGSITRASLFELLKQCVSPPDAIALTPTQWTELRGLCRGHEVAEDENPVGCIIDGLTVISVTAKELLIGGTGSRRLA